MAIATARNGLSFGTPNPLEVTMAETITRLIPSLRDGAHGQLRHRGHAVGDSPGARRDRSRIVKFEGCYHGHGDSFLVKAGSGRSPSACRPAGVPKALADLTLTLTYNDFDGATRLFEECGSEIACLIVEPVVGNANCLPPREGYLQHLRDLCTPRHGALLVFDEVMTGFRVALGGAQARYGVTPDLSTFGKVIGGGMPVGAYGGRRELMQQIAPAGPIYQAGTLSGNPVAMAAGLAMLSLVQAPGFHDALEAKTNALCDGLEAAARDAGIAFTTQRVGGMFGMFFSNDIVDTYAQAMACDSAAFNRFFHAMLERGVYLAPSAFEAGFMSSAHDEAAIADTIRAAGEAFRSRHADGRSPARRTTQSVRARTLAGHDRRRALPLVSADLPSRQPGGAKFRTCG